MNDEGYMRIALEEAKIALDNGLLPVGAIVVQDGEIIGRGSKNESYSYHLDHGEVVALRQALKDKNYKRNDNLTLYTTLEPCIMCYGTILHCPIRRVVYAADDIWGGATSLGKTGVFPIRHVGKIPEIVGGVLKEESKKLIRQFIETTDQEYYSNKESIFSKGFFNE